MTLTSWCIAAGALAAALVLLGGLVLLGLVVAREIRDQAAGPAGLDQPAEESTAGAVR
ncbi:MULTISPECIES: hypothetical protein [Protofrankia]|uniref:hypothetical protein n=1 Tax=Protofrankia TaxID=2994361 RepID=UPI0012F707BE|nr:MULTISPECIES: hypothetical protein [Protofrankia]